MKRVGDIMNRDVITIDVGARVGEAIQLMNEHDLHYLPVVEGECLVGIVTDRELSACRPPLNGDEATLVYAITLLDRPVHEFMRPQMIAVRVDVELDVAIDALLQDIVDVVCVVDDHHDLVGVVSNADLLLALRLERASTSSPGYGERSELHA
ncbi:MAG: CBS domain-containing protein [Nannocystaceae bacterium]